MEPIVVRVVPDALIALLAGMLHGVARRERAGDGEGQPPGIHEDAGARCAFG